MIKFPIVDVIKDNNVQISLIKFLIDKDEETLLDCPCNKWSEPVGIGSTYCLQQCKYAAYDNFSRLKDLILGCKHQYWIKCLTKEFYKNHGI